MPLVLPGVSLLLLGSGQDRAGADLLIHWDTLVSMARSNGPEGAGADEPAMGRFELQTREDVPLVATVGDFLGDRFVLEHAFAVEVLALPRHGHLRLENGGNFTYWPEKDFSGADSFEFRLRDPFGNGTTGSVDLFVEPENDAPTTEALVFSGISGNTLTVSSPGLLEGAHDADGDALWFTLASPPVHGEATLDGEGSFTYVPEAGFTGADDFRFEVSDGTDTVLGSVRIEVLPPPPVTLTYDPTDDARVNASSANASYGADSQLWLQDGAAGSRSYVKFSVHGLGSVERATLRLFCLDSSRDGGQFSAAGNEFRGTHSPWSEGRLSWNNAPLPEGPVRHRMGEVAAGTWVDIDVTDMIEGDGVYSFVLESRATDVARYSSKEGVHPPQLEILTIVQREPDDVEPVAMDDMYELAEDTALEIYPMGLLDNDTDEDGDVLYVVTRSQPAHGRLVVGEEGSFVYLPEADYNGPDSFTYTVSDLRGGMDSGTVALTILPEEDLPVAETDAWILSSPALTVAAPGILGNDRDADGDVLQAELLTDVAHGELRLAGDGSFSYVPELGFVGSDSFVYAARDGSGTSSPVLVSLAVATTGPADKAAMGPETQEETLLEGVFPNPIANGMWIEYRLGRSDQVEAVLYDARGHRVRLLTTGIESPGSRSLYWNGLDDRGKPVPAGIYFLRMQLGDERSTRKLVLQR